MDVSSKVKTLPCPTAGVVKVRTLEIPNVIRVNHSVVMGAYRGFFHNVGGVFLGTLCLT